MAFKPLITRTSPPLNIVPQIIPPTKAVASTQHTHLIKPQKHHLFTNSQKQPVPNITQARFQHALRRQFTIHASDPQLRTLGPLLRSPLNTLLTANNGHDENLLGAPFPECLNGCGASTARGDDGIDQDSETAGVAGAGGLVGDMVWEVVVVFDGVEGRWLAVHAEMVDGDEGGENGLHGWSEVG